MLKYLPKTYFKICKTIFFSGVVGAITLLFYAFGQTEWKYLDVKIIIAPTKSVTIVYWNSAVGRFNNVCNRHLYCFYSNILLELLEGIKYFVFPEALKCYADKRSQTDLLQNVCKYIFATINKKKNIISHFLPF